jgi:serine/threonine protein phosphatase PrpC
MLSSFGCSDPGPARHVNEDCFLADDDLALFVVADGMGGHAAGEVASRLTVESVENFIRRSRDTDDLSWPCGIDTALTFDGNRLRTAIYLANRRVFRAAEANDDYIGMGSTVVCALISNGMLTIGHVGDSRLYVLRDGLLVVETADDTWPASILSGQSEGSAAVAGHPMRHVLTNALGPREQIDIHISQRTLTDAETLLLCSDGVHGVLDDRALTSLLGSNSLPSAQARSVVAAALERGTRDNVTALVIRHEAHGG